MLEIVVKQEVGWKWDGGWGRWEVWKWKRGEGEDGRGRMETYPREPKNWDIWENG
jgi:hypothetical protein